MAEKAKIDILINDAGAAQTLGDLEQSAANLREELGRAAIGSEEYKKLNQALVQTTKQVKNLELGFESLDNEQVASEIGSVAGAIGDVTSAIILLGGENETLEEMARNIERALGVSMAFKGGIEGFSSAWKLFNNVLKSSPLFVLVSIITAIGAGFVWVANNWDLVVQGFSKSLGWIIEGLTNMREFFSRSRGDVYEQILIEKALEEQRKKNALEENERHLKKLRAIKNELKAQEEAFNDRQEIFDLDIARMDAEGKNSDALKKAKIEDQLEQEKVVLESIKKQIDTWRQYYEEQFALSGKSKDDFIAIMKGRGIDLVALEQESNDLIEKQQRKIYSAETKLIAFNRALREKHTEETLEETQEVYDAEKALNDARMDFLKRLETAENEYLDSKLDKEQQEINAIRDKYFTLLEEAQLYGESTLILEEAQQAAIKEIQDKYAEQRKAEEEEARQAKADLLAEEINKTTDQAEQLISIATSLNQIISSREMKRIQDKIDAGEKLTNREIKMLQRQDKINKAFAVAQIAADTARGISGAIAAGAGIPFPGNIAAIISGVSAVLAGVAQAQAVLGESLELPSIGDIGQEEQRSDNTQNVPSFNAAEFGSSLLNQDQKVYVVESDISGVQKKVSAIESQATF